jgi:hypothetical protein
MMLGDLLNIYKTYVWSRSRTMRRCRGYLHAKSLGKGGEYLSYIWLLMSYMGMETLAERMQRTAASPVTPNGEENV